MDLCFIFFFIWHLFIRSVRFVHLFGRSLSLIPNFIPSWSFNIEPKNLSYFHYEPEISFTQSKMTQHNLTNHLNQKKINNWASDFGMLVVCARIFISVEFRDWSWTRSSRAANNLHTQIPITICKYLFQPYKEMKLAKLAEQVWGAHAFATPKCLNFQAFPPPNNNKHKQKTCTFA